MVVRHDVAIVADDHTRAIAHDGLATTRAPTRIATEEEFEGIDHLLGLHLLGLLHLDVDDRLHRALGGRCEVWSITYLARAYGVGCILESIFIR